jgi:hypothetical protein
MRRLGCLTAFVAAVMLGVTGIALADPAAPAPTPVTCYPLLSSLVCQVPVNVNVGPFGPFNIAPNLTSIFAPPPA